MRFIFQYPDLHGTDADMLDAGPVAELAIAAEQAGWHGFAFTEHPAPSARWLDAGGHQSLDPFAALSHVAAVTSQLTLLTYLSVVPYRNPALLAKTAATLDRLSEGRFVLGVGTGYLKAEFFALGVDFDERNTLFDEALDVLPLYWSGEPFDYDGTHFSCRGTIGRPRPLRAPIPIWIGGNATRTLHRVAERAQGWMPLTGAVAPSTVRSPALPSLDDLRRRVRLLAQLAGERFPALDITVAYADPSIHDLDADVARHRDALAALHELGATWVVVPGPGGRHPRALEFLYGFAERYLS
jgi:probable F420-dependent oxidoreductase